MTAVPQPELSLSSDADDTVPTAFKSHHNLPVYRLHLRKSDDGRGLVHRFELWLYEQLQRLMEGYDVASNGLAMMIAEIAKNTADHAASDALFGLDVEIIDRKRARLSFVFGDLGVGIKQHIETNLPPGEEHRRTKMSLYEAYRLALKPGYTSNHISSLNRGHGMSIIVDCAIGMKMHLSVFDAFSRGLLSNLEHLTAPSHAGVRRIFHHVGHDVGFFYFGEVMMNLKSLK